MERLAWLASGIVAALTWTSPGLAEPDPPPTTPRHVADCELEPYHYRFVALDEDLPPGFNYDFVALTDRRSVYGNALACDELAGSCMTFATVRDRRGHFVIEDDQQRYVLAANERGVRAGFVPLAGSIESQAALFRGSDVQTIPLEAGQIGSYVDALSDSGNALVVSYDESVAFSYALHRRGDVTPVDLPDYREVFLNDRGILAGTANTFTGFRLDPNDSILETLGPVAPDPYSWVQGIDRHGRVLGYSFVFGGQERIGVWNPSGVFDTYFTEGTAEFPTISNLLLWSDEGLIVITLADSDYLVPARGVRWNVDDLVDDDSPYRTLNGTAIVDVNSGGDLLGYGNARGDDGTPVTRWFLLLRDDGDQRR